MKVKIIKAATTKEVAARIEKGTIIQMPSIQQGWRFNFDKELAKLKNAFGYLLITDETPEIIEGCMIFQLINKKEPYMAFLEVAPHNRTKKKEYDHVAGCLIAYAYQCRLLKKTVGLDFRIRFNMYKLGSRNSGRNISKK